MEINFPDDAIAALHRAEREINGLLPEISKAESCGVECDGHRAIVEEIQRRIDALKKNYPQLSRPTI